jgi:hypothetical protein
MPASLPVPPRPVRLGVRRRESGGNTIAVRPSVPHLCDGNVGVRVGGLLAHYAYQGSPRRWRCSAASRRATLIGTPARWSVVVGLLMPSLHGKPDQTATAVTGARAHASVMAFSSCLVGSIASWWPMGRHNLISTVSDRHAGLTEVSPSRVRTTRTLCGEADHAAPACIPPGIAVPAVPRWRCCRAPHRAAGTAEGA